MLLAGTKMKKKKKLEQITSKQRRTKELNVNYIFSVKLGFIKQHARNFFPIHSHSKRIAENERPREPTEAITDYWVLMKFLSIT